MEGTLLEVSTTIELLIDARKIESVRVLTVLPRDTTVEVLEVDKMLKFLGPTRLQIVT